MVEINGSNRVKFPYCADCYALLKQEFDSYPKFEKPKRKNP